MTTDPRFARFGESMWRLITEKGGDFCRDELSEDILPLAQAAGLCCRVEYDPATHGECLEAEPGDEIWWWGDTVSETRPGATCSACGGSGKGPAMYRPEIDKTQRDRCYHCQGTGKDGAARADIGCGESANKTLTLTRLTESWIQAAIRVQGTFGKIETAFMASPENEIRAAIWGMFAEYTRTLAAQLSDDQEDAHGWLEWFAWECDFGREPKEMVFADGEKLLVVGAPDLLAAISTDENGCRVWDSWFNASVEARQK